MPYTDLTTVKTHLLSSPFGPLQFENQRLKLTGTEDHELLYRHLVEDVEVVKWPSKLEPYEDGPVTLTDYDWTDLSSGGFDASTVAVALGRSLSTIYLAESDYQVDATLGRIRRVPGSGIPSGTSVYAYYVKMSIFARDTDYAMDYANGTIRRLADGAIPDGAAVLLDYQVSAGSLTDDLIEQAIIEAHDLIVRQLNSNYHGNSPDQGLKTGELNLVLAIVSRDLASEVLARRVSGEAAGRAREWQNLSHLYEARAWQILRPFLEPHYFHHPERVSHD